MREMSQAMKLLTSQVTEEWNTPEDPYLRLVREVIGPIELDPASTPEANRRAVRAERIYTKQQNGLAQEWRAKSVFCNPPYGISNGKSSQAVWSSKMVTEYKAGRFQQGILLINSCHGYGWYERLWVKYPVCCVRERIRFQNERGIAAGQSKKASSFLYFGENALWFQHVFSRIGRVILPYAEETP